MLDFRKVGDELEQHRTALARRPGFDAKLIDRVKELWEARAAAIHETQGAQERRNALNNDMKRIMREGGDEEKARAREEARAVSERVKSLEARTKEIEDALETLMLEIPNVPHPSVPTGADESANVVVRTWGDKPAFDFEPKEHDEIGLALGLLDFDAAARVAGARFVVEYGALAKMERALAAFMIDVHVAESGYREVAVPYMVNRDALIGTGQLPKFESDLFKVPYSETTDYFLVPTAEVPVTNLYRGTIIEAPLPIALCCHTPCFRSEAGAAGKDTRGMIRMHQFHKVELVRFVEPETSYDEHEKLVAHAEAVLQKLGLHYRVVVLSSGDLSASAAKCYDLEVWLPGADRYREISSCSNFEDYQARRARIRYKRDKKDKARLVHTLNGSGLPTGRTLIAILEQYQQRDGSVIIPEALRPYMQMERIEARS